MLETSPVNASISLFPEHLECLRARATANTSSVSAEVRKLICQSMGVAVGESPERSERPRITGCTLSVKLSVDLESFLRNEAAQTGQPVSVIVRKAIQQHADAVLRHPRADHDHKFNHGDLV